MAFNLQQASTALLCLFVPVQVEKTRDGLLLARMEVDELKLQEEALKQTERRLQAAEMRR
jgi:hypothetical protein